MELVAYGRMEPTTDEFVSAKGKQDVVFYRDQDGTDLIARVPWHYRSKPTKGHRCTMLNCALYKIIWLPDRETT